MKNPIQIYSQLLTSITILTVMLISPSNLWTQTVDVKPLSSVNAGADELGNSGIQIQQIAENYGKLPLTFEANQGQLSDNVKFLSRGIGYTLFLKPDEAVLAVRKSFGSITDSKTNPASSVLRMNLVGANSDPRLTGIDEQPGKTNYLIGNDPDNFQRNISNYARVKYEDVYPGIDLIYYGNQRQLEYDFIVEPGTDPKAILIEFKGMEDLNIDEDGNAVLLFTDGEVIQKKPIIYQEYDHERIHVDGEYIIADQNRLAFKVADYNPEIPLVIDPILVYSTYIGGSDEDQAQSIAIDNEGCAYVTGTTNSADFPNPTGQYFDYKSGTEEIFVTKISPDGSSLIYSSLIGGFGMDEGRSIAVDGNGCAYIVGKTNSTPFPYIGEETLPGTTFGGTEAFVIKLAPEGSDIVYRSFLAAAETSIEVDEDGHAYITGVPGANLPTTEGSYSETHNISDGFFVTKLAPDGLSMVFSTLIGMGGRTNWTHANEFDIAIDSEGHSYITGGATDCFVVKLLPDGSDIVFSTTFGGSHTDGGHGIDVGDDGSVYVVGATLTSEYDPPLFGDFPTTEGAFDETGNGREDAFVVRLAPDGSDFIYSTYIGGTSIDYGLGICVDHNGIAYITGESWGYYEYSGSDEAFPTTPDAMQTFVPLSGIDAFLTILSPDGSDLIFSTAILSESENGACLGREVALDPDGNIYVTGKTDAFDFPTTSGAYKESKSGVGHDGFVMKFGPVVLNQPPLAVCQDITVTADANCQADVSAEQIDNGSYDPDEDPITLVLSPVGPYELGVTPVTLTVSDGTETVECTANITVTNDLPVITTISAPIDPVQINTPINVSASYLDNNLANSNWDWGDGSDPELILGPEISAEHTYLTPGVFTLTLTLIDACGESVTDVFQYIVIYDPEGGFVTGGGWIDSPPGASTQYSDAIGKANFGFVSKYKKGSTVPQGNTEFHFNAGDLNFNSYVYDWLVIAGSKAKFKGEGTINGVGSYGFMISAIDGDLKDNGDPDLLRMKIWDIANGDEVIYDNQMGADDDGDPTTELGGGSIVIHEGSEKKSETILAESVNTLSVIELYPNPFSNTAYIEVQHDESIELMINVYDMGGRLIENLHEGIMKEDVRYRFEFTPEAGLASGTFIIKFIMENDVITKQLILAK